MAISRYSRSPKLEFGRQQGTSDAIVLVRQAVASGRIKTTELIVRGAERLDTLAGALFGDGRYWWVLAATSNIGWGLQVPPGTVLNVPNLSDVLRIVS